MKLLLTLPLQLIFFIYHSLRVYNKFTGAYIIERWYFSFFAWFTHIYFNTVQTLFTYRFSTQYSLNLFLLHPLQLIFFGNDYTRLYEKIAAVFITERRPFSFSHWFHLQNYELTVLIFSIIILWTSSWPFLFRRFMSSKNFLRV